MIWGLGTGRCGTKSLAKQLGGVHEPTGLDFMGYLYGHPYEDPVEVRSKLLGRLRERREMDVPIVVDARHSYMIPLIKQVDQGAKFVWIFRDPIPSIRSWLRRGWWSGDDEARYHPDGGFPESWSRVDKGIWYWRSVNGLIHENLMDRFEVWHCPIDLTEWEGKSEGGHPGEVTDEERIKVRYYTQGALTDLWTLRSLTRGKVL